ncbi:MAG: hypothetical protein QM652_00560 [Legionella sp.]|uniref:hypothetical protein n=1 Tax=Legionella sp. TaxID=459 RepID=UPI0039E40959
MLNELDHNVFINILAFSIALPLEIARFSLGLALTLLIAPVVALVKLFKPDLPTEEQHSFSLTQ